MPRASLWRLVVIGAVAGSSLTASIARAEPPPNRRAAALRTSGERLYRKHQYASASARFTAALSVSPDSPEILLDRAMSQAHLGDEAHARIDVLAALALSSRPDRIIDPRHAKVRKQAYFNLAHLESPEVGSPWARSCWDVPREPGCTASFSACEFTRVDGRAEYRTDTTTVRLGLDHTSATFAADETTEPAEIDPSTFELSTPIPRDGNLTFLESRRTEIDPLACEPSDADDCSKAAADGADDYECTIAYANACTGLVGLVCSAELGGTASETRVVEYVFDQGAD